MTLRYRDLSSESHKELLLFSRKKSTSSQEPVIPSVDNTSSTFVELSMVFTGALKIFSFGLVSQDDILKSSDDNFSLISGELVRDIEV